MTVALGTYDVGRNTAIERELKRLYDQRTAEKDLEPPADKPHNEPQLNEAPVSGEDKLINP
jgi:hypothetical protein